MKRGGIASLSDLPARANDYSTGAPGARLLLRLLRYVENPARAAAFTRPSRSGCCKSLDRSRSMSVTARVMENARACESNAFAMPCIM